MDRLKRYWPVALLSVQHEETDADHWGYVTFKESDVQQLEADLAKAQKELTKTRESDKAELKTVLDQRDEIAASFIESEKRILKLEDIIINARQIIDDRNCNTTCHNDHCINEYSGCSLKDKLFEVKIEQVEIQIKRKQ